MNPQKIARAIVSPLLQWHVLFVIAIFTLLLSFGIDAIGGGIWLGALLIIFCLPPLFRYQVSIVESHARGKEAGVLTADDFGWVGSAYAFFPLPLAIALAAAAYFAHSSSGVPGVVAVAILSCVLYPASLALLAITHSPLQSINPVAVFRLYTKSDHLFWIAPAWCLVMAWPSAWLLERPLMVAVFGLLLLMFSLAALCGALIEPKRLVDEVGIPDQVAPLRSKVASNIENHRTLTLTHAYAFISRDNRDGGFNHIIAEIERDPDPARAWMWYFERMQTWDEPQHALFFAQLVIQDMLKHGETIPALKLVMRCRLLNEQFRPRREDIPALIEAAEQGGNTDLAAVLKAM